jgi:hypothetical protein
LKKSISNLSKLSNDGKLDFGEVSSIAKYRKRIFHHLLKDIKSSICLIQKSSLILLPNSQFLKLIFYFCNTLLYQWPLIYYNKNKKFSKIQSYSLFKGILQFGQIKVEQGTPR